MSYKKVDDPTEVARYAALRERGVFVCDAAKHNDEDGCDNPDCFKYRLRVRLEEEGARSLQRFAFNLGVELGRRKKDP